MAASESESSRSERRCFSSVSEEDLDTLVEEIDAKNTKDVISFSQRILMSYCKEKDIEFGSLNNFSEAELCSFLRTFYAEVRQSNGDYYAKRSLITLRYGLHRHFQKVRSIDINNNTSFKAANDVFRGMLHKLKEAGKGAVQHKEPITPEDMRKIRKLTALDISTPLGLQNKVFVDIMLHLCNRGRENWRAMKEHFAVVQDSSNERYVHMTQDMKTKNHCGECDEVSQGGRMYETHDENCPVESFLAYISHLNPKCEAFWQRPKPNKPSDLSTPWFDNAPIGMNTMAKKMSTISTAAKCSKIYTNHCLCATSINTLDSAGFEARHIMSISGHRSETSIKHYSQVQEHQNAQWV